jgi:rhodanese-related sulfurtransferase
MKRYILTSLCLGFLLSDGCSQGQSANRIGHGEDPKFDREVARWLDFSVPAIDVDSLRKVRDGVLVLDAREPKEYAVSHIPGAMHIGYDAFQASALDSLDRNIPVVVYCSIGYRSEKIAKKLQKQGFSQVSNLYGSIFEWANRGYPLETGQGEGTKKLHTYSRLWSRWVKRDGVEKVY